MLNITQQEQIAIGHLEIGDTFDFKGKHFVVIDENTPNINSIEDMTLCFSIEDSNIEAFDNELYVELKEIDCYIRDYD